MDCFSCFIGSESTSQHRIRNISSPIHDISSPTLMYNNNLNNHSNFNQYSSNYHTQQDLTTLTGSSTLDSNDIRNFRLYLKTGQIWENRGGICVITGRKKHWKRITNVDHILEGQVMIAIIDNFILDRKSKSDRMLLRSAFSAFKKGTPEFKTLYEVHNDFHNLNNLERSMNSSKGVVFKRWQND